MAPRRIKDTRKCCYNVNKGLLTMCRIKMIWNWIGEREVDWAGIIDGELVLRRSVFLLELKTLIHNHTEDYYLGKREWGIPEYEPVRSAGFL
jgi:hypothetical protein